MPFKKRCAGPLPPPDSQALEPASESQSTLCQGKWERSSFSKPERAGLAPVSAPPRGSWLPATCRDGTARALCVL